MRPAFNNCSLVIRSDSTRSIIAALKVNKKIPRLKRLKTKFFRDFFNSSSLTLLDLSENIFECNDMVYKFVKYAQLYTKVHIVGYNNGTGYSCAVTGTGEVSPMF